MSIPHATERTRTTPQRAAVLERLRAASEPMSAQAIKAELGRSVGLATVYRTLQQLVDAGQVDVFRRDSGEAVYRLCRPIHHHHLLCVRCKRVEEIDACEVEPWARAVAERRGFEISGHQADIFGTCAECRTRGAQA
jgi:Fur family transcriptional regulator, ferric uptake regulator